MTHGSPAILVLVFLVCLLLVPVPVRGQRVTVQNGATVWMLHEGSLNLGSATRLVEEESSGARVSGGTGTITATRILTSPSNRNVAGLDAMISSSQNLGTTVVTRGHAIQSDNGNVSIKRYFDIDPVNNSGLDAALTYHYRDAELNGRTESELTLFRSNDGGTSYTTAGVNDRNTDANTLTLHGIDHFSRWTAGSEGEPLPVELVSFEGRPASPSGVQLTWRTASERDNAAFRVQKKRRPTAPSSTTSARSGKTWKTIGRVEGAGTTTRPQSYRFAVDDLPVGTHTFRLVQVDVSGSTTSHPSIAIKIRMEKALKLTAPAPNPVRQRTSLTFATKTATETTIALYNVLGQRIRTLYQETPPAGEARSLRLNAGTLSPGVYFVRLRTNGKTRTRRMTVVR